MSSFWMDWILIVTPGFAASKSATVASQYALPSPVVELCQKVISVSPLVAAATVVVATATGGEPRGTHHQGGRDRQELASNHEICPLRRVAQSGKLAPCLANRYCHRTRQPCCPHRPSPPQIGIVAGSASASQGRHHRGQWCSLVYHLTRPVTADRGAIATVAPTTPTGQSLSITFY